MKNKEAQIVGEKPKKVTKPSSKPDQIIINPKTNDDNRLNERVVDIAQRVKRRALMKRVHAKLARRKQISRFRLHSQKQLAQKSSQIAKQLLRQRLAGPRGAQYQHLSAANKVQIDQVVDKKAQMIRSMAMKLVPRLKSADVKRLQAVRNKKGVKGIKSYLSNRQLNQGVEYDIDYLTKIFEQITDKDISSIQEKAIQHSVPVSVVELVFIRGLVEGDKNNAYNRVNSFLSNGLAAKLDSDLTEKEVWDKPNPNKTSKSMTPAQKAEAKARAKKAGRPYPNLVDNMAAMKESVIDRVREIISERFKSPAWSRKEGKNKEGGLNRKGIASYRAQNPGSKLSMAVTTEPSKLDPKGKAAKRRKSFCARMSGVDGPMKKPNGEPTRKALALRKWNC